MDALNPINLTFSIERRTVPHLFAMLHRGDVCNMIGDRIKKKKTDEPLSLFAEWYHLAHVKHVEPQDTVMCVSTVSPEGRPSSRMVLLKSFDENGFVFYTNLESRKARHIQHNPYAALCFFWPEMLKQVRIEGAIAQIESEEADAYFATRPRESQIASWASSRGTGFTTRWRARRWTLRRSLMGLRHKQSR